MTMLEEILNRWRNLVSKTLPSPFIETQISPPICRNLDCRSKPRRWLRRNPFLVVADDLVRGAGVEHGKAINPAQDSIEVSLHRFHFFLRAAAHKVLFIP